MKFSTITFLVVTAAAFCYSEEEPKDPSADPRSLDLEAVPN